MEKTNFQKLDSEITSRNTRISVLETKINELEKRADKMKNNQIMAQYYSDILNKIEEDIEKAKSLGAPYDLNSALLAHGFSDIKTLKAKTSFDVSELDGITNELSDLEKDLSQEKGEVLLEREQLLQNKDVRDYVREEAIKNIKEKNKELELKKAKLVNAKFAAKPDSMDRLLPENEATETLKSVIYRMQKSLSDTKMTDSEKEYWKKDIEQKKAEMAQMYQSRIQAEIDAIDREINLNNETINEIDSMLKENRNIDPFISPLNEQRRDNFVEFNEPRNLQEDKEEKVQEQGQEDIEEEVKEETEAKENNGSIFSKLFELNKNIANRENEENRENMNTPVSTQKQGSFRTFIEKIKTYFKSPKSKLVALYSRAKNILDKQREEDVDLTEIAEVARQAQEEPKVILKRISPEGKVVGEVELAENVKEEKETAREEQEVKDNIEGTQGSTKEDTKEELVQNPSIDYFSIRKSKNVEKSISDLMQEAKDRVKAKAEKEGKQEQEQEKESEREN